MRVLVTGGAGYIGSVTVAHLLAAGHDVEVIDDLRSGRSEAVPEGVALHRLAITDERVRDVLWHGFDACLHFAAWAQAGASVAAPEAYFANNTAASLQLLEMLVEAEVERFVLSSTCAVYGQPDQSPVDESAPLVPVNPYGASKLAVEQALEWVGRLRGLRWAALRYFNAAGAHGDLGELHDPETHLIPLVLRVATGHSDRLVVHGDDYPTTDGTCVRDYVHVCDLAEAHVAALDELGRRQRLVVNLGTGHGYSVGEVVKTARRVTGCPIPTVHGSRRPGDPAALVAASGRARKALGWEPTRGLEDMVADAWQFTLRTGNGDRGGGSGAPMRHGLDCTCSH